MGTQMQISPYSLFASCRQIANSIPRCHREVSNRWDRES